MNLGFTRIVAPASVHESVTQEISRYLGQWFGQDIGQVGLLIFFCNANRPGRHRLSRSMIRNRIVLLFQRRFRMYSILRYRFVITDTFVGPEIGISNIRSL